MITDKFARVTDRIKAVVTDSIVLIVFMVIVSSIFAEFEHVPNTARIIAFIFIFFLYDPIFTSFFGGTIGHIMLGLRVKREKNQVKNINFPLAIIRFLVKVLLGWVSFLTVSSNTNRKAIHDSLVGSVVLYKGKNKKLRIPTHNHKHRAIGAKLVQHNI